MSILEPPPETVNKSRPIVFAAVALTLIAIVALYFTFRYYPEKRAADHFFAALVAGDTARAYQLWKPGPSYLMKDFLADWGPDGYYGPVKSYAITKADARRSASGVVVTVNISPYATIPEPSDVEKSRKTRVVSVWVESKDHSFSFPP
ncbi:MAG: hypothetical protein ACRD4H_10980 [Candidatus Acidiferrales bacterium]